MESGLNQATGAMVHVAATGGSLLVSYLVVAGRRVLPSSIVFVLVGFLTTTLDNVLLVFENTVARFLR